jgi:hypothetical protein
MGNSEKMQAIRDIISYFSPIILIVTIKRAQKSNWGKIKYLIFFLQGFGSVSGSASAWIRINLSCWIWIRIRIQIADPDPDPGGQKWPKKLKKGQNYQILKCWMFSFEG